jgi:peroxiredoxin
MATVVTHELLNRIAPDFTAHDVNQRRLHIADFRGFVTVLLFWSAECPWSRRTDVFLVYRQMPWEQKGVRIFGIASNASENENEILYEAERRRVKYPIGLDLDGRVANQYKAETTPHFFVLDRKGIIRYIGALDDATFKARRPKRFYLDDAVNTLIAGQLPNPAITPPYGCTIVRNAEGSPMPIEVK